MVSAKTVICSYLCRDSWATDKLIQVLYTLTVRCDDNQVLITKPIHNIIPHSDLGVYCSLFF